MALMTPEQFEESLKTMKPKVFMNGKRVENVLENRNTRTVVEANKASYAWALDPQSKDIMSCHSPLIDEVVNRYTHVSTSNAKTPGHPEVNSAAVAVPARYRCRNTGLTFPRTRRLSRAPPSGRMVPAVLV